MSSTVGRSRADYVCFLERAVELTQHATIRVVLESAVLEASAYDRTISPLASLARLVEACDAVENGEAAALARELGQEERRLRPGRTPLNSQTVDAYIRLRSARDQRDRRTSEWIGPRDATLRRPGLLKKYLDARREAAGANQRSIQSSRARRAEELIAALPTAEDRQEMRFLLEKGLIAQRELALLKKAIETNFPAVKLGSLLGRPSPDQTPHETFVLSDDERRALALLRNKLQDNEQLRHFGMVTDGHRLKVIHGGAHFLSKNELSTLMDLFQLALPE